MRLAAVGIALGIFSAPGEAQSRLPVPGPRPARLVWVQASVDPFIQDTLPKATTGAGTATYVGAAIGAGLGFSMVHFGCGINENSCGGTPYLIGLVSGGLLGAMIGSAFEGDQPPKVTKPAAAEPPPP